MLMLFLEQARGRPTWSYMGDLVPAGITLVTPGLADPLLQSSVVTHIIGLGLL